MLAAGAISEADISASAARILTPLFAVGVFDTVNNNTASDPLDLLSRLGI